MTNEIQTNVLTPEVVKSKLQICLSGAEKSIQKLNDAEANLVYNEDNLAEIKNFIDGCKSAEKIVEDERVKLKEPFLQGSRNVDAGAKLLSSELAAVKLKANVQYQKLCDEVARKQREAAAEQLRVDGIRKQMNDFKTTYAVKISDAKTSQELVSIERLINLETGNKNKYAEFLEEFRTGCEPIRSLITAQKETVRKLEELERQALQAAENGSDEQVLEFMEQKEVLEAKIAEKAINIQEEAVSQASQPTESATVIIPLIPKGGRLFYGWDLVDIKAATKKGWTKTILDDELVNQFFKENKDKIVDEVGITEGGVRFFVKKKY